MATMVDDLEQRICAWISRSTGKNLEEVTPQTAFWDCGLDSLASIELAGNLEDYLGVEVSPAVAWEYPTIAELARYLADLTLETEKGETVGSYATGEYGDKAAL